MGQLGALFDLTVSRKLVWAEAPVASRAVMKISSLPVAIGVPLKVLVLASNVSQEGSGADTQKPSTPGSGSSYQTSVWAVSTSDSPFASVNAEAGTW